MDIFQDIPCTYSPAHCSSPKDKIRGAIGREGDPHSVDKVSNEMNHPSSPAL